MRDAGNVLERLERWYAAQCNEDWEHTYGVKIDTLDNPGWSFKVDLTDTYLLGRSFEKVQEGQNDDHADFLYWEVKDRQFVGYCPPHRLREVISIFLSWAEGPPAR
ncbi:immunity 53 family protein [Bradyrhizobium sp. WSM1417]|uniref:immunity 53 family protein n=1 Tax=Bradyrhizobium sp. WSM1417 TaxID=754500 RepID=UPI0004853111|nr:immunity 53 family protein [Bradyrhizobium sp. WSM1417]